MDSWVFRTNGSDRVTIDSGGDFGIGTTNPGAKLDVRGGIAAGTNGTEFTVSTAGAVVAAGSITGGTLTDGTFSVSSGVITGATWNGNSIADAYVDNDITLTNITQITNRSILDTSGTLTVARGGTGATTFTQYGIIYGNGTSALQVTAAGADNQVLIGNTGAAPGWANASTLAGQIDHGSVTGLSDDDHTQYALLAGRSGGQILIGGTGTTDGLTLQTTSGTGTTGADMHFLVGDNGGTEAMTILNSGYVGIGTAAPTVPLEVSGRISQIGLGDSIIIGNQAGANDDLTNNRNIFIGGYAGYLNTSGVYNSAIGYSSLYNNIDGQYNTAIGYQSLYLNNSGDYNQAIGAYALRNNTSGNYNIGIGYQSLYINSTASYNTAIGYFALYSNTNSRNTAIGYLALRNNSTWYQQ